MSLKKEELGGTKRNQEELGKAILGLLLTLLKCPSHPPKKSIGVHQGLYFHHEFKKRRARRSQEDQEEPGKAILGSSGVPWVPLDPLVGFLFALFFKLTLKVASCTKYWTEPKEPLGVPRGAYRGS